MKKQKTRKSFRSAFLVFGLAAVSFFPARGSDLRMFPVRREMLCVTEGTITEEPGIHPDYVRPCKSGPSESD
ncbi:MAG: hypothetical protein LAP21_08755 [Acidobacteriia bacterium]|nr:hypothetical protein [Terriglobia bacterium]